MYVLKQLSNVLVKLFLLMTMLLVGVFAHKEQVYAAENHTQQVTIYDWDLLDENGLELSESNLAIPTKKYQLTVSWRMPINQTINDGDFFTIDLPQNELNGSWKNVDSNFSTFEFNGQVVGEWRITGGKIEAVFRSRIETGIMIQGTFTTGSEAFTNYTYREITQAVTVGGLSKIIAFEQQTLSTLKNDDEKRAYTSSNNSIGWSIHVNNPGLVELTENGAWGQNFTLQQNTYLEDPLPIGTSVQQLVIYTSLCVPNNLDTGISSNEMVNMGNSLSKFTNITPNDGESYETFKARLAPLQYGIYTNSDSSLMLVINFGTLGANGLRYTDVAADYFSQAAQQAISRGYYGESDYDDLVNYFTITFGSTNTINGQVAAFRVNVNVNYEGEQVGEQKNTATITRNGTAKDYSATAKLESSDGSSSVVDGIVNIHLSDMDTQENLSGGTFKLQYKNVDDSWVDYQNADNIITNDQGEAQVSGLSQGTYRFVQIGAASALYDLSSSEGYDETVGGLITNTFIITESDITKEVLVTNLKFKYTIIYAPGLYGSFEEQVYRNQVINSGMPTFNGTPVGQTGYTFIGWTPEVRKTVTENVTYTALWSVNNYKINYILTGGENAEANPIEYEYGVGVEAFLEATREGHIFTGWVDESGEAVTDIATTATGDKDLYATWKALDYAITYHLDGGVNAETNPDTYTHGVGVASFEEPTKEGYTFLGWVNDENNAIKSITRTETGDKVLYAQWQKQSETVNDSKNVKEDETQKPTSKNENVKISGQDVNEDKKLPQTGATEQIVLTMIGAIIILISYGLYILRENILIK